MSRRINGGRMELIMISGSLFKCSDPIKERGSNRKNIRRRVISGAKKAVSAALCALLVLSAVPGFSLYVTAENSLDNISVSSGINGDIPDDKGDMTGDNSDMPGDNGDITDDNGGEFSGNDENAPYGSAVYGDINSDGRVNVFDLCILKKQCADGALSGSSRSDLDGNGTLDSTDVRLLESYIMNNIITFPATAAETGKNDLFYYKTDIDENGDLNMIRKAPDIPMGAENTWTVFVYMCGSNLESYQGAGSADIQEMLSASTGSNVRFIVETGGSTIWKNKMINAGYIQRFEICGGKMTKKDEQPKAPMCESGTLSDFLKWGVKNYPAGKMGVVLWNHGGGCISGVCSDELYGNKLLSIKDADRAFAELSSVMTDKFEFIGFDACIMAEIECANICSKYARYMYGSQELEPGSGWDYTALGNCLGADPAIDGRELGIQLCGDYYKSCSAQGEEASSTFSCIDLSKVDELIINFNSYAKKLFESSKYKKELVKIIKRIREGGDFGSTTQSMSYTNMVDMLSVMFSDYELNFGIGFDPKEAVGNTTVCVNNGSRKSYACGLSVYYPLAVYDVSELVTFAGITVSPYYLSFVDMIAFNQGKNNISTAYDNTKLMDMWLRLQNGDENAESELYSYWESYNMNFDGTSALIQLISEPKVIDGKFTIELSEDSLENIDDIRAAVWAWSYDRSCLYEMGDTKEVIVDGGKVSDNFSGSWPSLPDGQNLAMYVSSTGDDYTEYVSPVLINQREALLVFTVMDNGTVSLDGYCYDFNEEKMSSRLLRVEKGDVIIPLYYSEDVRFGYAFMSTGTEYTYDGQSQLSLRRLEDGMYSFGFTIYDIFGLALPTDYATFTIRENKVDWGFNMSRNVVKRSVVSDTKQPRK